MAAGAAPPAARPVRGDVSPAARAGATRRPPRPRRAAARRAGRPPTAQGLAPTAPSRAAPAAPPASATASVSTAAHSTQAAAEVSALICHVDRRDTARRLRQPTTAPTATGTSTASHSQDGSGPGSGRAPEHRHQRQQPRVGRGPGDGGALPDAEAGAGHPGQRPHAEVGQQRELGQGRDGAPDHAGAQRVVEAADASGVHGDDDQRDQDTAGQAAEHPPDGRAHRPAHEPRHQVVPRGGQVGRHRADVAAELTADGQHERRPGSGPGRRGPPRTGRAARARRCRGARRPG